MMMVIFGPHAMPEMVFTTPKHDNIPGLLVRRTDLSELIRTSQELLHNPWPAMLPTMTKKTESLAPEPQ